MASSGKGQFVAYAGRMFRVFVSSTFSDLQAERDALQKEVFPKLRDLCRQQGARFQAVDLRWGVSEEASLDQQAATICLNEIERCRQVSPRPNFLVLLGDRYGSWLPPTHLPASEFEALYKLVSTDAQQRLDEWYQKDTNAVPVEYCLLPRAGAYSDDNTWAEALRALRDVFLAGAERLPDGSYNPVPYRDSITEQEIRAGVLDLPGASDQVCCFFRRISNLEAVVRAVPSNSIARSCVDLDQAGLFDATAHRRLEDLKARLQARVPQNMYTYETQWTGNGLTQDYLAQFCSDVYTHLKQMIEEELAKEQVAVQNDHEIDAHRAFAEEHRRHFTGRADILEAIERYIAGTERSPLIVSGASGVGKSTLMAQAIQQAQRRHPTTPVVARFVGVTPASMDERALLQSLCHQISQVYEADEITIPTDLEGLVKEFPKRLALATEQVPLVLFLDALDQLGSSLLDQDSFSLKWLPTELPLPVRLVVSTTFDSGFTSLSQRLAAGSLVRLEPMSPSEGQALLDLWLADAHRTLQEVQKQEVLSKFAGDGLPLYLKLAFEEAHRWKSYTPFAETQLASGIPGLLNQLFDRLSLPINYGTMLVAHSLGYLGAAKEGLSEDEMLDLLSLDHQVLEDFRLHSPRSPKVDRLPIVIWSRLFFDLEPYLTEQVADGTTLMTFYHRQLASAVADRYLSGEGRRERHQGLADYFLHSDVEPLAGEEPAPNLRKLAELPYQQTLGELWSELSTTLTDLHFLAEKALYVGVSALETDLSLASRYQQAHGVKPAVSLSGSFPTVEPALPPFESLSQIIVHISHLLQQAQTLAEMGGLLLSYLSWQPAFAAQRLDLEQGIPRPFLTAWHPLPDRSSSALLRTLAGHTDQVTACAFSLDSHWIVSASNDKTLKVWNATSGARRFSLTGHTDKVTACAFSPDGRSIVSASDDKTLKVWDAAMGTERFSLFGHPREITACTFSPDGRSIVSASNDKTLKVWDAATGTESLSLTGHTDKVTACAFSPDGRSIVSASDDKTLKVWDAATGTERLSLIGHTDRNWPGHAMSCAFSPDGRFIASASGDKTRKVWDANTGAECLSLTDHTDEFSGCAFSPDSRWIVSASNDKTLKVWDAATGTESFSLTGHTDQVTACAFSPDSYWIVSASNDKTLKVWDTTSEIERFLVIERFLGEHTPRFSSIAFSPDGLWMVYPASHNTLKVQGQGTNHSAEGVSLIGHTAITMACAFSPDGRSIVSADWDGTLKIWDAASGVERGSLIGHTKGITAYAFSSDGRSIVSASNDKTLKVWDIASGVERLSLIGHTDKITACAFSSDGRSIVSASNDKTLKVWDAASGRERPPLTDDHIAPITACAFNPDGRSIVSASDDGTLQIWDAASGKGRRTLIGYDDVQKMILYKIFREGSPRPTLTDLKDLVRMSWAWNSASDKKLPIMKDLANHIWAQNSASDKKLPLLASLKDMVEIIWDDAFGKKHTQDEWFHTMSVTACAFSPNGRSIVTASKKGTLRIWNASSRKKYRTLTGHTDQVNGCAFSPNGRFIVSASEDETLKVWDATSGVEHFSLKGHTSSVKSCAVSPNGRWIVSVSSDYTLKVWDLRTGTCLLTFPADGELQGCAFHSDGEHLIAWSFQGVYFLRLVV